jgi:hypothetical protein
MRAPSTTASDFDSCRAGSACARRTTFSPSAVALVLSALVTACLALLGFASSADASLNYSGFLGSRAPFQGCGCLAGELDGPGGIVVNSSGNGAPAGTIYVAEGRENGSNNRISEYSPAGKFVRAWGAGVVQSGPGQSDEVQSVRVDATGGSFKLTFKEETTSDISATATAGAVESALDALSTVNGNVTVGGGPGDAGGTTPYLVRFDGGTLDGKAQPEMVAANGASPLTGGAGTVTVTTVNQGAVGFEICEAGSGSVCTEGVDTDATGAPAGTLGTAELSGEFRQSRYGPEGVAINQTTGDIYVSNRAHMRVDVFSATGQFLRAFGNDVVASGPGDTPGDGVETCTVSDLCKTAALGDTGGAFGASGFILNFQGRLAVVPAGAPNAGNVVVADPENQRVQEFTAAGAFVRAFGYDVAASGPGDTGTAFEVCNAATDVCKEGTSGSEVGQFSFNMPDRLAVDGTGAIYTVEQGSRVQKFSPQVGPPALAPSVVGENETQTVKVSATAGQFRLKFLNSTTGDISATATAPQVETALNGLSSISSSGGSVSVSGGPGDAGGTAPYEVTFQGKFAKANPRPMSSLQGTTPLSGGTGPGANQAVVATPKPGGPNSSGESDGPIDVAIGAGNNLFVSKLFPAGSTPVCPDGTTAGDEYHFQELTPAGATVDDSHGACNGIRVTEFPPYIPTSGMAADPVSGYLYESKTPNGFYPNEEDNRVYVLAPGGAPAASLDLIDNITATSAVAKGSLTPNSTTAGVFGPVPTLARLEYKLAGAPSWTVYGGDFGAGAGFSPLPIAISLDGLEPNRSYEARLVVTKQFHQGVVITPVQSFDTLPAPPRIEAFFADNITATSVEMHALINPLGQTAKYRFEYGATPEYGSSAPIPAGEIASGTVAVPVETNVDGLNGGVYHFRVVAENTAGTSVSGDQTFTFYPPSCPNESLRQQTGAAFLPDCRAYELVSPARAGNVILNSQAPVATEAMNPSRFAFSGFLGGVRESGEPTSLFGDVYIATRTVNGWQTNYTGIPASEGTVHGGPQDPEQSGSFASEFALGSAALDRVIDWNHGQKGFVCCGKLGNNAPTMFDAQGTRLTRLPTNADEVPGATTDLSEGGFIGAARPSPDFSHYVFSTADLQFAPGGVTTAPGSVYDNDIETDTVTLISKTAAGDIPPGTGGPNEVIRIPAVSTDGSHILMSTKAGPASALTPVRLYMSIDNGLADDVSIGQDGLNHGVTFQGMTRDGGEVYMTSAEQLTADDHDSNTDLFVWRADDPDTLDRISQGSDGSGDSDECASSWISKCSIQVVGLNAQTDNVLASDSGDLYFYSPEQLVPGKGVPGQRNLYVYRDGGLRHLVALNASASIDRIQVSSDGSHLALLTREKLTTYNNAGFTEMYTYDVDAGGPFKCVSCIPDGGPPTSHVGASENGIFLTDDGRAFFTTGDPLVPEDINAKFRDVYEFVQNRAQLITSGSSPMDANALIGVSRNGTDAYFTTTDTLVPQDLNGPFRKFYVARTGGGFAFDPPPAPCQAADECHGPSTSSPPPVTSGTSVPLGKGGNVVNQKGKKHKKKKKSKSKKKKSKKKRKASDRVRGR